MAQWEICFYKFVYNPQAGHLYTKLPKPKKFKKSSINIVNKDNQFLPWHHIRHLHPVRKHTEQIKKFGKEIVENLDYNGREFSVSEKSYYKTETQNNIWLKYSDMKISMCIQFGYWKKVWKSHGILVDREWR